MNWRKFVSGTPNPLHVPRIKVSSAIVRLRRLNLAAKEFVKQNARFAGFKKTTA
ncbi:MAG: hypothetical protein AABW99_04170 [archaeon]